MKFSVLYKKVPETANYFTRMKGSTYGNGVNLIGLKSVDIVDNDTGEVVNQAFAFLCKASWLNYLKHKARYGKYATHKIGW